MLARRPIHRSEFIINIVGRGYIYIHNHGFDTCGEVGRWGGGEMGGREVGGK